MNTAEGRARRIVRRFATEHELHRVSVLRVHQDSPHLKRDFARFLERLGEHCGRVKWLAIPEYDEDHREHIHLFTSLDLDETVLRDIWISPYGSPDPNFYGSAILATIEDIRTHTNYLSKGFALPVHERPAFRRYRNSQHPHPQPIVFHNVTKADVDLLSQIIGELTGSRITTWTSDQFWCPEIRTWAPTAGSTTQVVELLNSYKPV